MSYKIMHKTKPHCLLASGFYSFEWVDKTMKREDLIILEEGK